MPAASGHAPHTRPDTTQAPPDTARTNLPTLRECGVQLPPLSTSFERGYHMADSPERRTLLRDVAERVRAVQACYGDRRPRIVMSTYRALVTALFESGQPDAALRSYDAFFERYAPADDSSLVSWMHSHRGRHHFLLGNPSRSLRDYARSVELTPAAASGRRIQRLNNLALTYVQLREWDTALHYLRRVEAMAQEMDTQLPTVRREYGRALAGQALLLQQRLYDEAHDGPPDSTLARLERVSQQAFTLLQPIDTDLAVGPLIDRAEGYMKVGRLADAASTLRQAQETATGGVSRNRRIVLLRSAGWLAILQGRLDEARTHLNAVRQLATQSSLIGHQRNVHTSLGQISEQGGRLSEAQQHYETAVALSNAESESIRATLWSLRSFSDQRYGYDGLMRTLRAEGRPADAFDVWTRSRGRFLRDTRLQTTLLNEMSAEVRMQYDSLTTQINALRAQRASSSVDTESALLEEEAVLIAQRNDLVDLSSYVPSLPREDLQRWLRNTGRTLVAYHVDTPHPIVPVEETVSAYVVRPDTVIAVTLPHTPERLNALVERVSPLLASDAVPTSLNATAFDLNALHEAYAALIEPLQPHLPDSGPLVVAPDGPLFRLPFGALVTEPPASRYAYQQAAYLIESRPVLSTLSPSLLVEDATAPARNTDFDIAAFGVSEFDGTEPPRTLLASEIRLRSGTDSLALPDLPGVSTELDRLQDLFANTHLSLNSEATPSAVQTHGRNATVVHLASHALLSPTDPLNSAFVLAREAQNDGLLRVQDIMQPSAQVPFVVLSGCSTARGELRSGEGLLGLQYAFQASGARSTLSHLWPTDDATAVDLSTAFYRQLRSGHPKDVALQRAQLAFMEAHPDQHSPFFWGSPVLFGAPTPLALEPARSGWVVAGWVALGLGGCALLWLLGLRYRRRTAS